MWDEGKKNWGWLKAASCVGVKGGCGKERRGDNERGNAAARVKNKKQKADRRWHSSGMKKRVR